MVVDQRLLGLCNGSFDGMQLLGNLEARPRRFDHVDHAAEVTFGAPQAPDDFRMALVDWVRIHGWSYPPEGMGPIKNYQRATTSREHKVR